MTVYEYRCDCGPVLSDHPMGQAPESVECAAGHEARRYFGSAKLQFTDGRKFWDPNRLAGSLQANRKLQEEKVRKFCARKDNTFTPDHFEYVDGSGPGGRQAVHGGYTVEPHMPSQKEIQQDNEWREQKATVS